MQVIKLNIPLPLHKWIPEVIFLFSPHLYSFCKGLHFLGGDFNSTLEPDLNKFEKNINGVTSSVGLTEKTLHFHKYI